MVDDILFYALLLVMFLWLCLTWYWLGPWNRLAPYPGQRKPAKPPKTRFQETKPFSGCTTRVFEVDPYTVLQWLVEAADHLQAFSQYFLHDVRVTQVQLDELYALVSAVKAGHVSDAEAIQRLERSPHWVWVAMDPVTKLLLTIDVGERTLAMAQRVIHQVVQVVAPDCVPLFLTDGFKEYMSALLTHYGRWVQPSRRRAQGAVPKPRWMPLPQLLYA
jgi:hypothetical protein